MLRVRATLVITWTTAFHLGCSEALVRGESERGRGRKRERGGRNTCMKTCSGLYTVPKNKISTVPICSVKPSTKIPTAVSLSLLRKVHVPRPTCKTDAWCPFSPSLCCRTPLPPTAAPSPASGERSLAHRHAGNRDNHVVRLRLTPSSAERRHPALRVPPSNILGWGGNGGPIISSFRTTQGEAQASLGGALSMSGSGTDGGPAEAEDAAVTAAAVSGGGGETKGAAEGDNKVKVPWVSWVSLVMLLLVYVSNQWTRSLVYCECRVHS